MIGGVFAFSAEANPTPPPFLSPDSQLFLNARSAIAYLAESLVPKRIWLPTYLCAVVAEALPKAKLESFEVGPRLEVAPGAFSGVRPRDLVVIVDYFGFPPSAECFHEIRERGGWSLEDASQALLTESVGLFSDFHVFSPRKFLGVPDGGILNGEELPPVSLKSAPGGWTARALQLGELRTTAKPEVWFPLFQNVEASIPTGNFRMSVVTESRLRASFDYVAIAERRRRNYRYLADCLSSVALYPNLPPEVTPLGFPIVSPKRDVIQRALFRAEIYPAIHWPGDHPLSKQILTLPCDQRYGESDMARIVQAVSLR